MSNIGLATLVTLAACGVGRAEPLRIGPEPAPMPRELTDEVVVASLIAALDDPDAEVRSHLAVAIAEFRSAAVPALIHALKDASRERRAGAAYAISQMRPPDPETLPALLAAVKDPEEIVRRQAAYAISRVVRVTSQAASRVPDVPVPPPDPTPGGAR